MKIKFLPQNLSVPAEQGKSVMETAREHNLPLSSSCNGMCVCAECKVYIVDGEENVLPPSTKETELIGGGYVIDRRRLSCQLFCFGDLTVNLSEQVERDKNQKGIKKQFLKKINKTELSESSSLGGVLLEQDKDIQKIMSAEKADKPLAHLKEEDNFYESKKPSRQTKSYRNRRRYRSESRRYHNRRNNKPKN